MSRRVSDPSARRLRNFVLLVIFAVALPSLLLTGFGLIAINNERDAALERVKELYWPVTEKLIGRVKGVLVQLTGQCPGPLDELESWGLRRTSAPGPALAAFRREYPFTTNYFVVDQRGQVRIPRDETPLPSWQGFLPPEFQTGLNREFAKNDPAGAAVIYGKLLSHPDHQGPSRCLVLNALGRSLARAGESQPALDALEQLIEGCPDFVDSTGYNLALGAWLLKLELEQASPEKQARTADRLARVLANPDAHASNGQIEQVAGQALQMLRRKSDPGSLPARGLLQDIAERDKLVKAVAAMKGKIGSRPALIGVRSGGVRRLVLVRDGENLSGCLLSPAAMHPLLQQFLTELEISEYLTAHMSLIDAPPCETGECPGIHAGTVFLRDTELTWRMDLLLSGSEALDQLAESRTRLYFWALLLLVVALVLGIGRTVQIMIRETRLSRLKTDFVSSVSHELRTPLTSIRMFTETLLLGRVSGKEEERECLETIGQETERLSRLVERILDFSRMEAGRKAYRFKPESVKELIDAAVSACRPMIEQGGFEVETRVGLDLPALSVDRDAMVEVLINLLSNAIKYSPSGRKVGIQAEKDTTHIDLSVTDQGLGIPRSEHKRIFEKFYRVDIPLASEVSGSGLGLSLVKYIVQAHRGEILVDSTPGKGSTFTVRLPLGGDAGTNRREAE